MFAVDVTGILLVRLELADEHGLDDVEALAGSSLQVESGILQIQPPKHLPAGVSQPEKGLAALGLEPPPVTCHTDTPKGWVHQSATAGTACLGSSNCGSHAAWASSSSVVMALICSRVSSAPVKGSRAIAR